MAVLIDSSALPQNDISGFGVPRLREDKLVGNDKWVFVDDWLWIAEWAN